MGTGSNLLLAVLAVLFPPLPVWIKRSLCSADSLINIALCCLGFIPGLLHAWYIIATTPDWDAPDPHHYHTVPNGDIEAGREGGRPNNEGVRYYYVNVPAGAAGVGQAGGLGSVRGNYSSPEREGHGGSGRNYGTLWSDGGNRPGEPANESAGGENPPPTYGEAVQGDNKVQK